MTSLKRPFADLEWTSTGPVSVATGDVYFSAANGLEETRSVFLKGAGFPERFNDGLTIVGELGFGTGLNFLALWQSFIEHAPESARLHFVSVEGFPLRHSDGQRALAGFREIQDHAGALLKVWPSPHNGPHRRVFENGRVTLTVYHDTVEAALAQMDFAADAWFLDGFAPAKNPDMWDQDLYAHIARLSKPGAPAASFTVAGHVRRGLAAVGFEVSKQPGFGRKRERMEAIYTGSASTPELSPLAPITPTDGPIAIIGGGIAAASLIEAFKRRGRDVSVFASGGWADGASSAPRGLVTPRLALQDQAKNRAFLAAFDYALTLYGPAQAFKNTENLHLVTGKQIDRAQRLVAALDDGFEFMGPQAASQKAGEPVEAAIWQARSGQVDPAKLIAHLVADQPFHDVEIGRIEPGQTGIKLYDKAGQCVFDGAAVIYAGGAYGAEFMTEAFTLNPVAGRVGVFASHSQPALPIDGFGYVCAHDQGVLVGSTHIHGPDPDPAEAAAETLKTTLSASLPKLAERLGRQELSWGGVRASSPDKDPIMGNLPEGDFSKTWAKSAKGHGEALGNKSPCNQQVLALTGLGGRGFTHAPLLAEALVSGLCGEPVPLERDGLKAFHPARFLWRALKRA